MKVSVIIPCHNVEGYVEPCLLSVLAQDHPDLEVICVDDGSTDGTCDVIERVRTVHAMPIKLVVQPNAGAAAARNRGSKGANGEYVQFLDADDRLLPGKIAGQIAVAEAEGMPDLIIGDYEGLMPNGLLLPIAALHGRPWMGLIKTRLGTTSANLWKRATVDALGGWDETLASSQDYDLMFRMMRAGASVAFDPCFRTRVLKRPSGSISRTGVKDNWMRYTGLRQSIKEHLRATDPKLYAEEIATLEQHIFMALHVVSMEDLPSALGEYRRCLPKGFLPEESRAITRRYVMFHRLLGFGGAVRLSRVVKRVRSLVRRAVKRGR